MTTATAKISSSLCCYSSVRYTYALSASKATSSARFPRKFGTAFAIGSPLSIEKPLFQRNYVYNSKSVSIRCEQSSNEGSGIDVWVGRLAMGTFAAAITVEIITGKGLLENFGLTTSLPTVALVVTVLMGVLIAFFIFRSASEN